MHVQFLYLKRQYKAVKQEITLTIRKVYEDSRFIGGKEVLEFEK